MRKIVAGLFISLDGVVEAADQWMGPTPRRDGPEAASPAGAGLAALLDMGSAR